MYIRRIDDHEVRCLLDEDDLDEYDISLDEIMMGNEKARRLIEDIITKAEAEYGFKAGAMPLSVEIRPVQPNKLALLITSSKPEENPGKQELISGLENIFKTLSKTVQELKEAVGNSRQEEKTVSNEALPGKTPPILLKFTDYDSLCQFLKRRNLPVKLYKMEGDVYYMEHSFYLWFVPGSEDDIWKRTLVDYGEEISQGDRKREVLEEHGKKLGTAQKLLESITEGEDA